MDVGSSQARSLRVGFLSLVGGGVLFLTACSQPASSGSQTFTETKSECKSTAVKNQYIVHWKDGSRTVEYAEDDQDFRQTVLEPNLENIHFAEQDQKIHLKDTLHARAVSAENVPQDWGQQKIQAAAVWSQGYTGQGVIVAVVDSGTDVTHVQLKNQLAINTGEVAGNGVDDDQNGYIDDVNGYDFANNTGNMTDDNGHGTHVSGIIVGDSTAGAVKGVAQGAKLLPLRFMDSSGEGDVSAAISALAYAAQRGAKVINASWGGAPCSQSLKQAITDLQSKGVLFVSAAGNDGVDIDVSPEYPSAYGLANQINVGASTINDYLAGFSNTSYTLVNLVAPGADIYSTYKGGSYAWLDGTSMASPFVAGAAAVLWSARPNATVDQIRTALNKGVDAGDFPVATHGRLNLQSALNALIAAVPQ